MGDQNTGYIGGQYWVEGGAFHNGFKGFVSCYSSARQFVVL